MKIDQSGRCTGQPSALALGRQMTVEFYDCNPRILSDVVKMEEIFLQAARVSGATVVDAKFHAFEPQGVSGVVIISESHFAVHAWPEHDYAAVDLFTCGENVDFSRATAELGARLESQKWIVSSLMNRGIIGHNGVERLVPVVEQQDNRAVQLSWKSRFEQTGARAISAMLDFYDCQKFVGLTAREIVNLLDEFLAELQLETAGERQFIARADGGDFMQVLTSGRISGAVVTGENNLYLDLSANGFFDPRVAAETGMRLFHGRYYRLQPQVRQ